MHEETAAEVAEYRKKKRASSAKRDGGNWLPVAQAANTALDDMRTLYKTLLHMRDLTYSLVDKESPDGRYVTPAASEWDCILDDVQRVADGLRAGLKGRSFLKRG